MLETDQYWGDVNYMGVVEAQGSILRSSSMWMVSYHISFTFGFLVLALDFNILIFSQVCYFWRLVNPQMITQVQNVIV